MNEDLIHIRTLEPSDSLEDLTALLHESYRQLADLGLRYVATHQSIDITRSRIEKGICFVAETGGQIIGTITYYPPGSSDHCEFYQRPEVAHMGQMGVRPNRQRQGIGLWLISRCEEQAKIDGARELALDTAEPAEHLIRWYAKLGYRFIEHADWSMTNYRSVILSKKIDH